ncbi:MAG: hypothetical protein R3Y45_03435 [Bacillota bacterium]
MHNIWNSMMYRCTSPKHKEYKNYGGKGVTVCESWRNYFNFKEWAINHGYTENLTLERMDNDGDYCPLNCIWISRKEQCLNRSNTLFVDVKIPLILACRLYDLPYESTRRNIRNGKNINEIIKKWRIIHGTKNI